MLERPVLDFIVIGAQKSGTTSLFQYLRHHPGVFIPPEKEAPFFDGDAPIDGARFDRYLERYFPPSRNGHLWGTVSPQYMGDRRSAARIRMMLPDVKLIAILRHPIDRAVSQFRMRVRRGLEPRPIEVAFEQLLQPRNAELARGQPATVAGASDCYLVWSEYGRILEAYRALYPKNQLLVLFFDDLQSRPGHVLGEIVSYLGLTPGYVPPNLDVRYVVSGSRQMPRRFDRLKGFALSRIGRFAPSLALSYRMRSRNWNETEYADPRGTSGIQPSAELRRKLEEYFRPDIQRLEAIIERPVPWHGLGAASKPVGSPAENP
ncbi:MAG: sulfotransferase [Alphaproteobacteria bacterium]